MQSMVFVFVVFAAVAVSAQGEDCSKQRVLVGDKKCCNVTGVFKTFRKGSFSKCLEEVQKKRRPGTPSERDSSEACFDECLFTGEGLLTPEKMLDKKAVSKMFNPDTLSGNGQLITSVIEKCLGSYEADIDSSLDCKSGSYELGKCLSREFFLHCPSSLIYSKSPECDEFKAKVLMCPKASLILR